MPVLGRVVWVHMSTVTPWGLIFIECKKGWESHGLYYHWLRCIYFFFKKPKGGEYCRESTCDTYTSLYIGPRNIVIFFIHLVLVGHFLILEVVVVV